MSHADEIEDAKGLYDYAKQLELQLDEMRKELDKRHDWYDRGLEIEAMKRLNGEQQKVIEGCRDVFSQFCGESGPVIAHPPKCGFYKKGKQEDCNCTAKNTANDVLLSLKACREILKKPEPIVPSDDTCIPKPTGRALQYCSEYQKTSHDHSPTCTFWKRVTHGTS